MSAPSIPTHEGIHVYAAVLDVLGYRARLAQDRNSGTPQFKTLLQNAMAVLNQVNEAECGFQVISDTIFLTWFAQSTFKSFLETNKRLFVAFLEQGLFLRGGITYSQHFKSGYVTYSYAFAGAYDLESKSAIYPRIVIDENIIELFQNSEGSLDFTDLVKSKLILRVNGTCFLNIIDDENWSTLRDKAAALFENDRAALAGNESAFAKHVWFENYLFQSKCALGERYIPKPSLVK